MTFKLIKNGTIIDGNGGEPLNGQAILLSENTIQAIGKAEEIIKDIRDVTVIDAKGGYVLPGLIDTHVHVMLRIKNTQAELETPFSIRFFETVHHLKETLESGITTVRDAGYTDVGVKEAVERGLVAGPRMQVSITPLTITGGHSDSWMRSGIDITDVTYPTMPSGKCDGAEEVVKKVREVLRAGADVVKVHATGGVMSPTDHPDFTQFSQEELEIMVREANFRKGIKVMAHAQGAEGIKNAVRAGIHSIEHGIYLDDEAIELMLERGTYLIPTLLAPVSVLEMAENSDNVPAYALEKAREAADEHRESIAKAYKAGVKIAMGTDAGVMAHGTNLRELKLMCDIGMTPMESIIATTKTAATCMGWEDKVGTIETGKLADLVISNQNPLDDIQVLENSNNLIVIKDGEVVKESM